MDTSRQSASPEALRRLRWAARRGLRENDLVLERFFAIYGRDLEERHVGPLAELLALEDNDLWDLISGRNEPAERLRELVDWLRSC